MYVCVCYFNSIGDPGAMTLHQAVWTNCTAVTAHQNFLTVGGLSGLCLMRKAVKYC